MHAQSNENIAKRKALESQTEEIEQRHQNPEITNQAENEAQLKALFNELNQLTEKEAIQAQTKAADESEIDVDEGLGSDPPDFAQTREDNVPMDDSDEHTRELCGYGVLHTHARFINARQLSRKSNYH